MSKSFSDSSNTPSNDSLGRRLAPRVAARFAVQLYCQGLPGALEARTSDIGPSGICVETASPFALDSIRRVVIALPEGPLQAKAEGRWQRENAADNMNLTGIQLTDLDADASSRLWGFVHQRAGELASFLRERTEVADEMDEALDLALYTRVVEFPVGHTIHLQDTIGGKGDSAFLVYSGRVLIEARYKGGSPFALERVEAGGLFGGLPMIAGVPHVCSASTECEVMALEIDPQTFRHLADNKPRVAHRIMTALVRRQASHVNALVETAARFRQGA